MDSYITLQFVSEHTIGSFFIEWGCHSRYAHVDTVLDDGHLLGARPWSKGVAIRPPDYMRFKRKLIVKLKTTDKIKDKYMNFQHTQLGKPYDWGALIMNFVFNRDWRGDDKWFCSELIAAGLEEAGYFPHKLVTASDKISPADLLLILSAVSDI